MLDSRMCLHALLTSSIDDFHTGQKGSTLANYTEFLDFTKDEAGKINGAVLMDKFDPNSEPFTIKAKVVVNCAGCHADEVRRKDEPKA